MTQFRNRLPQLDDSPLLTDGGMETTLVFHDGVDLPYFAAFNLLKDEAGSDRVSAYYRRYADIARSYGVGFVLETPTWRASADWGARLGYDQAGLAEANRKAVDLLLAIRAEYEQPGQPYVISGNIGPRGDGYRIEAKMSPDQARAYHAAQIETFADTDADLVSALTLNYSDEAIGVVGAARDAAMPVVISFTVETDGRLPSGETLADAIMRTDQATDGYASYFMLNCAHPTHFSHVFHHAGPWSRLRGLRANASAKSHAELDESTELDMGDPGALGGEYEAISKAVPSIVVFGGCCGTDHRHVEAIAKSCLNR